MHAASRIRCQFCTLWLGRLLEPLMWPCASTPTTDHHSLPFSSSPSFPSLLAPTSQLYLLVSSQRWFRLLVPVQSQVCCHDCCFVPCKRRSSRHVKADKRACLSTTRLGGLCSPVRGPKYGGGTLKSRLSQSWNRNLIKKLLSPGLLSSKAAADLRSPYFD